MSIAPEVKEQSKCGDDPCRYDPRDSSTGSFHFFSAIHRTRWRRLLSWYMLVRALRRLYAIAAARSSALRLGVMVLRLGALIEMWLRRTITSHGHHWTF